MRNIFEHTVLSSSHRNAKREIKKAKQAAEAAGIPTIDIDIEDPNRQLLKRTIFCVAAVCAAAVIINVAANASAEDTADLFE